MKPDYALEDLVQKLLLMEEAQEISPESLSELAGSILSKDKIEDIVWIKEELIKLKEKEPPQEDKYEMPKVEVSGVTTIESSEDVFKVLQSHSNWVAATLNPKSRDIEGRANLAKQSLVGIKLKAVDLRCANLEQADFSECDLSGANFSKANLQGAVLKDTILYGTNFKNANMQGADLRGAKIHNCNFQGICIEDLIIDASLISSILK